MKKLKPVVGDFFDEITIHQKRSIFNLLFIIVTCDVDNSNIHKNTKFLNECIDFFDVNRNVCQKYFTEAGYYKMIKDLNDLNQSQKELLIIMAWEAVTFDGTPSERERFIIISIFKELKIGEEEFLNTIDKMNLFIQKFG